MEKTTIIFAKLAGLKNAIENVLEQHGRYIQNSQLLNYFNQFSTFRKRLIEELPDLYSDLPEIIVIPNTIIDQYQLLALHRDLSYIFEVWSNSRIGASIEEKLERVFISHGRSVDWLKVQNFIEKDIKILTLELAQEANLGRTVLQKLSEESDKCSYSVIIMTGDDYLDNGPPKARENVMHEIGFFQGKYGLKNVCLLYEEGTNIPSNISGLVYIPYPKDNIEATFGALTRELKTIFLNY